MNIRESVLKAIAASGEDFLSGGQLAENLGVSRTAVWKAIKALEADDYLFDAVSGRGYRISPQNNRLSAELIRAELNSHEDREIIVFDEIDSTNNYAKKLASEGASHGTVIAADKQSAGRGRLGRSFFSPSGTGLYMSVIIRPEISIEAAQLITSCAACAAAEALEGLCGRQVDVKWVNDLYMNGKKICGILTEASLSLETSSLDYAVIGIGMNVLSVRGIFSSELSEIAASVEDEAGVKISRNKLCAEILGRLDERLEGIENREFLEDYRRREILTGNVITASAEGERITGRAVGIDDSASLIVELEDGSRRALSSGEANLCRIKNKSSV